ncbi:hypothetical protein ACFE33_12940 [Falsihalocynthiibacter sp. SS001]|uniref:hypothetical protein n=1 Tax=Falsihalocynthiibacter sp. SS001 TaxID=3349698 RepID=UPI0036D2A551
MKPSFALELSLEGIRLFARAEGGWRIVGETSVDAADLGETLKNLREKATQVSGHDLSTKLIIPNSQILYANVAAPGPSDAEREAQIREALTGMTPYDPAELAFDWRNVGDMAQIAAVAQQTLHEAETFALEHHFNPVSFVSIPDDGEFDGEPFFGPTAFAQTFLNGDTVEPDTQAVKEIAETPKEIPLEPHLVIPEVYIEAPPAKETKPEDAPAPQLTAFFTSIQAQPTEQNVEAPKIPDHLKKAKGKTAIPPAITSGKPLVAVSRNEYVTRPLAPSKPPEQLVAHLNAAKKPEPKVEDKALSEQSSDDKLDVIEVHAQEDEPEAVSVPIISASAASEGAQTIDAKITEQAMDLPDVAQLSASLGPEATLASAGDYTPPAIEEQSVFGAPKTDKPPMNPRHIGAIASVVLLLLVGLAMLWRGGDDSPNEGAQAAVPPATEVIAEPEIETLAEVEITDVTPPASEENEVERVLTPLTLAEAQTAYDTSGIWQKSPRTTTPPEIRNTYDLYLPSLDPELDLSDAVALPTVEEEPSDIPLAAQATPAPAGSTFALDEEGLVTPSADGTLNPDGILVFEGAPSRQATPRPVTEEPEEAEVAVAETQQRRPTPRPDNLSEIYEAANLGGRTRDELARLRPVARPVSEQISAQTSPEGVSLSTNATKLAVAAARIPQSRPSNFAAIVEKARAKPISTPTATTQTAAKPETIRAPAVTGPKIPTRASVAGAATQKNQISMSKVALIGVYGTPSRRSALVRMSNGKIVEIGVGDRLNGGKVAAIGSDQVHYIKQGKNYLLKMPSSG